MRMRCKKKWKNANYFCCSSAMRCEFWFRFRTAFAFCSFSHIFAFFSHFSHFSHIFRIFLTFFALFTTFWCTYCEKMEQKVRKCEKCDAKAVWCDGLGQKCECERKNFSHYHPCVQPKKKALPVSQVPVFAFQAWSEIFKCWVWQYICVRFDVSCKNC